MVALSDKLTTQSCINKGREKSLPFLFCNEVIMENNELVNIYIENLLNEVVELTKTKLLLETKLKYQEKVNNKLQVELQKLSKREKKTKDTDSTF
jgi:hypothetical protein